MVTYSDLIQFCILIVALVGLCHTIFGKKIAAHYRHSERLMLKSI